jgi:acetoacetyl-CoA synthetase
LWTWSTTDLAGFWRSIWDYHQIASPTPFTAVLGSEPMPGATWFNGAQVNFAREIFRHVELAEAAGVPAIVAENERGQVSELRWTELRKQTASLALELRRLGVGRGDRVAAYLPNIPEAVIGLLACASIGAIWTSCAPDMGAPAVLERFRQTSPKVLIAVDGVFYAGKAMDRSGAVADMRRALPSVVALLVIPSGFSDWMIPNSHDLRTALSRDDDAVEAFEPEWLPFDHPLWILFSSGTTGLPKAIVHGHGGVIVSARADHLHYDLGPSYSPNTFGDRFHWYSSTGWVMWNIQVCGLLAGAIICIFGGILSLRRHDEVGARARTRRPAHRRSLVTRVEAHALWPVHMVVTKQ